MRYILIFAVVFIAGCSVGTYNAPPVTDAQAALIANPTPEVQAQVEAELPDFLAEDTFLEQLTAQIGRPLTARELQFARLAGVRNPDRVRIAVVPRIPAAQRFARIKSDTGIDISGSATRALQITKVYPAKAMAARYSIVFAAPFQNDLEVLVHELVHIRQYEELGPIGMARRAVTQAVVLRGKTVIPIETEAVFETARLLGTQPAYYPY
ncbi:MAG: hypothetical protein AAF198_07440 [Pseudomonadota bacterium]